MEKVKRETNTSCEISILHCNHCACFHACVCVFVCACVYMYMYSHVYMYMYLSGPYDGTRDWGIVECHTHPVSRGLVVLHLKGHKHP